MRILFFLVLLLGLGIAGAAGYLVLQRINGYTTVIADLRKQVGEKVELTDVAITTEDLTYGAQLTKENVKMVRWPVDAVPENAFTSIVDLFGEEGEDQKPRTILRNIDLGEMVSVLKVTGPGQDAGVASRLERGMRAFTLKVDVASGVSGFLRPGDKIDVYWTGRSERGTISRLILDGIDLIAIDQLADADRSKSIVARTVTVSVSPEYVAALAQAQATGKLQLSLRGIGDDAESGEVNIDQNTLLNIQEEEVVEKKEEKKCFLKRRNGSEIIVTEIQIPCPK